MSVNSGRLIAPLNIGVDIPAAIGYSSTDLGTLCKADSINKFAKYKPVRYAKFGELTSSERKSTNYGLSCYEVSALVTEMVSSIPTTGKWGYTKPNEYYRATDFLNEDYPTNFGYNHSAKAPASGFKNITIYSDEINSLPTYTFNAKFGDSSWEGIGDTSGIEIPLNQLTIISGMPISNGNWRFGLAIYFPHENGGYIVQYASHEKAITSLSSSADISKMIINLSLSDRVKQYIKSAIDKNVKTLDAIPFIGYNLTYVTTDPAGKYFRFLGGGRAFCMPEGEKITINIKNASEAYNVKVTGGYVMYYNIDAGNRNFALNEGGISTWTKPKNSYSCGMTVIFDFSYNSTGKLLNASNVYLGLETVYINQAGSIEMMKNGTWTAVTSVASAGTYRITARESYTEGTRTALSTLLNNLPSYTTTNNIQPVLGIWVRFGVNRVNVDKKGASITVRMLDPL